MTFSPFATDLFLELYNILMPEGNAFQPEERKTATSQNLFAEKHEAFKVVICAQGIFFSKIQA